MSAISNLSNKIAHFLDQHLKIEVRDQADPSIFRKTSDGLVHIDQDTIIKTADIKAPVIKIQSLLSTEKLIIDTDLLIIDGGYVTKPQFWDIHAKDVHLINSNQQTQWLATLIQKTNGHNCIESSNYDSSLEKATPASIDIPAEQPNLKDRFKQIGNEIKDLKNKIFNR